MVHVCFSLYDKTGCYSKFLGTSMLSLFENTHSEVTIHILHDNTLTQDNRNKFIELTKHYGQVLKFYNVKDLCASKIAEIRNYFPDIDKIRLSIGAYYRLFILHIFPVVVGKVIYLDSDIIVNLDVNELWQIEIFDNPLAAVLEIDNGTPPSRYSIMCRDGIVKEDNYFNSGVLVMNLKVLRKEVETILSGVKFTSEHPKYDLADQDILNYCFETRTLKLPVKFNRIIKESRNNGEFSIGKEIYHYAGGRVGLGLDMRDPFNRLWWSYFIKTPWFSVDTIGKILRGAQDSMLNLSDMPPNRSRVFIVDEEHAYQIEKNFSVRDDEEIIVVDTESEDSLQKLMELVNSSRNKSIFFVGIPNIDLKLLKLGLVRDKDFFNVCGFYSPMWADLTNRYKLILSL